MNYLSHIYIYINTHTHTVWIINCVFNLHPQYTALTFKKSVVAMDKYCRQKHPKIWKKKYPLSEEVSSIEWEFINMTEQEEDIIRRMHKLVGDKWALIAGRVPGRKPEEIERYWLMRNSDNFKDKRREYNRRQKS